MYLKSTFQHNPALSNIAAYYRIVESYRNEYDRVCHRSLLNIGFCPDATLEQKVSVMELLNAKYENELLLFEEHGTQVIDWVKLFLESDD
jgi:hypothetical protein